MNDSTVVIGAGISGLLLARSLAEAGASVVVLEKSRGLGGRMATKRAGEAVFDQGAQFFTAREPAFAALVEEWRGRGLIRAWTAGGHRRWIGSPSMTAVPKALAEGLEVLRENKASSVRRHGSGHWEIEIENGGLLRAGRVLFTCPVPQALAVLQAGGHRLPEPEFAGLSRVSYRPCLALLVTLDGPAKVPEEGLAFPSGPVRWIADNVAKGVAQSARAAVTIHASADFSASHYGRSESEIASLLLPAVDHLLGAGVVSVALHRWKFSEPDVLYPEPCLWLPEQALGFAGDGFGGPKVEGAALSGLALAARVGPHLVPRVGRD